MLPWFGHSGDMGDVIYALPTIRAAGGGVLYLYHQPGKTWHGMDAGKVASLRSLLIQQSYIFDVVFCSSGQPPFASDHDLNGFRDHWQPGRNLADMHLATHGFGTEHRDDQWLSVDYGCPKMPVIFARSERCRNVAFPWNRIWKTYHDRAGFVGSQREHEDFCRTIGMVPWFPTADLAELARVIAGCVLFVGNQSCPAAIAEGLKRPIVLEVYPPMANCCFQRPGRIDAWDGSVLLADPPV
jgi:hypothetical protein